MSRTEPTTVAIVPHTHWDREWYEPFQTFRMRLVTLFDALLPMLESDPSYARFLLDGQTVVLDDYLEIRPDAHASLERLAAAGRISVGPWMVLMDEFMVSGETIVRDLQYGLARAGELGGAMDVGYLPDMFGHVAQMPQLFRLAGMEHAVVWRGVPAAVAQTAFWWEAPDGSRVRAEYLYGSYSNGRDLPPEAADLVRRAAGYEIELGAARLGSMLLMNGTDHQMPQPWLGRVVAEANERQRDYRFVVTSLAEYLPEQPTDGLTTVAGELRSGARANLLMGVGSNRVDVHRACAAAERALERRGEPLSALFLPADRYPDALASVAWHRLVCNSAHDSSCACSADEVVDQVVVRYAEARQIGEGMAHDAVAALAAHVDAQAGATVVVNPTARPRSGMVEITVPGEGPVVVVDGDCVERPTQVVGEIGGDAYTAMVTGTKVRWVLDLVRGTEFAGRPITAFTITEPDGDDRPYDVALREAGPGDTPQDLGEVRERLLALGDAGATARLRLVAAPLRRVLFDTGEIPGFGWSTFRAVDGRGPASSTDELENEHVRVEIDPATGTFSMRTVDGLHATGLGRLVDGGDGGDTYSYSPPAEDRIIDTPGRVTVTRLESGPVRRRARIDADYAWPARAIGDFRSCSARSDEMVHVTVHTTLELRTGERFLRVTHELDNPACDHRLRAHFPLPAAVTGSDAECAFAVVHRGLTAEGGPQEFGLPTFPSRRFVDAYDGAVGLALLHDGLLEYELVDGGRELALTLLRSVGFLSRSEPALRPAPAGPTLPVRGALMLGEQRVDYAVLLHAGDWRAADCYGAADAFLVPFARARAGGHANASRPASGTALRVDGAEVSAVLRERRQLVVRVFRTARRAGPVTIEHEGAPARGWIVDLRGERVAPFEGSVELRAWELCTLHLDDT
jgi:alpha-mannosidase